MRLPRLRLRLRSLLLLVALAALALFSHRLYQEGPENHWLLLNLRYGDVAARGAAVNRARQLEIEEISYEVVASVHRFPPPARTLQARWRLRQRRAELLLPALADAANDPDPTCRADALKTFHLLALPHASGSERLRALRLVLAAARDREDSVRAAAVDALWGLAGQDTGAAIAALRSAAADPAVEVRRAAAWQSAMLGMAVPATRPEVTPILIPLLSGREDPRVRARAAEGVSALGICRLLDPTGTGPDAVPALVAALRDPIFEVRVAAAMILGATMPDARGRRVSSWERKKGSIIPALERALSDESTAVREESALALFTLGERDPAIIELMKQAARDRSRFRNARFDLALKAWHAEREGRPPAEPTAPGDEAP